ncbi:hypothetical protein OAV66_00430 [Planktomarina temperata]|nr:hypothetical protein [Planktomarina temperata]
MAVSLSSLVAVYTLFEGGIAQTIMRIVAFNYERSQDIKIIMQRKILALRNQALILMFLITVTILFLSFRFSAEEQVINNFYTSTFLFAISISARLYAEMLVSYIEGMQKVETAYTLRLLASMGMCLALLVNFTGASLFLLIAIPNLTFVLILLFGATFQIKHKSIMYNLNFWKYSTEFRLRQRSLREFQATVYANAVIGFLTFGTIVPITNELSGLKSAACVGLLMFGMNLASSILGIPLASRIANIGPLFAKNDMPEIRRQTRKLLSSTLIISIIGLVIILLSADVILLYFNEYDLITTRYIMYFYLGAVAQVVIGIFLNIIRSSLVDRYVWISIFQAASTVIGLVLANTYGNLEKIAFTVFAVPSLLILPIVTFISIKEKIIGGIK